MPFYPLKDGGYVHIKMAKRPRRRCAFCTTGYEHFLCDFPLGDGHTCDKPMCLRCVVPVADGIDYCPKHKAQPVQASLF